METYKLLDRFEVLYPTRSKFSDLRRIYNDEDLSSLFRLVDVDEELRKAIMEENLHSIFRIVDIYDTEELRKAVIEKNLHSIFRLIDDEELRKFILEDNTWKLWPILNRYVDTQFIWAFKNFFVNGTKIDEDCFSRGQLESKLWLIKELTQCDVELGTVFLCAGWYATLATMIFESGIRVDKIRSFDIDKSCIDIAEVFNKPWFADRWCFKSITHDIMDIDYNEHTWQYWSNANNRMSKPITDTPDTIINTSCEHLTNFIGWYSKIPEGKLIIIQANNFHDVEEHVNTYNTVEEFSASAPMTTVLYEGELELPKYKRFMKIGYR